MAGAFNMFGNCKIKVCARATLNAPRKSSRYYHLDCTPPFVLKFPHDHWVSKLGGVEEFTSKGDHMKCMICLRGNFSK